MKKMIIQNRPTQMRRKTLLNDKEQEFWNTWTKWLKDDINICHASHANLACVALICCGIDALSGYYYGVDIEKIGDFQYRGKEYGPLKRFAGFVEKYLHDFVANAKYKNGRYKKKRVCVDREKLKECELKYSEVFYKQFRCGLVHEGFMKQRAVIDKWGKIGDYFSEIKRDHLVLNIDRLWPDFEKAVDEFKQDVECKPERAKQFRKRYRFMRPYG